MKRENEVDGKDAVEQADALFGSQQYEEVYQVLGESKVIFACLVRIRF